jgi:hypothetical protein
MEAKDKQRMKGVNYAMRQRIKDVVAKVREKGEMTTEEIRAELGLECNQAMLFQYVKGRGITFDIWTRRWRCVKPCFHVRLKKFCRENGMSERRVK